MNKDDIIQYFEHTIRDDPDISEAVAAIKTLIELIKLDTAETLQGLRENLKNAIDILTQSNHSLVTSTSSGCELFLRFITLTALDIPDFQELKQNLVERGNVFLNTVAKSRHKIANFAQPFITDGTTILIHSRSRVVLNLLRKVAETKKRFTVYVTEAQPDRLGEKMCNDLKALGIPTILILDCAVGYIMEKVDMVLVGAEGVVENGGIINKLGTNTIAVVAKAMNKPVYVLAESFKFARLYPLNQADVPNQFKFPASKLCSNLDLTGEHPMVDYTPPTYITLLFTDLAILTPSAVSDELIKLYL